MSLKPETPACFDSRVIPLPNLECVKDYFSWRQEDAHRNSLNAHCYWMLRKKGISARETTKQLEEQAIRNKLITELELKTGAEYQEWVISLLQET